MNLLIKWHARLLSETGFSNTSSNASEACFGRLRSLFPVEGWRTTSASLQEAPPFPLSSPKGLRVLASARRQSREAGDAGTEPPPAAETLCKGRAVSCTGSHRWCPPVFGLWPKPKGPAAARSTDSPRLGKQAHPKERDIAQPASALPGVPEQGDQLPSRSIIASLKLALSRPIWVH